MYDSEVTSPQECISGQVDLYMTLAVHEILANEAFIVADGLIYLLFIVTFVYPIYVQIALIQSLLAQLSL